MSSPSFDSNTWYSLQNFGNDYYVSCASAGNCAAGSTGTAESDLFQFGTANGNLYVRTAALAANSDGDAWCVNINSGQPAVSLCNDDSAVWAAGYWNGTDSQEGLYFYNTESRDPDRLYLSNDNTLSFLDYTNASTSDLDLMRWATRSVSSITDASYTTVPVAIAGVTSTATTTSSSTTSSTSDSSTTSSSSETSSSVSPETSTSTAVVSSTLPLSTATVNVTPTVTASASTSRTSTAATTSPTLANAAGKPVSNTMAAVAVLFVVPRIISMLS